MSQRRTIDEILAEARARLDRVEVAALADEVAGGALLVDIRPLEQRQRDGELPGAVVIDRNVLEWRLDPTSANAIAEAGYERRVIIVCNEGYSSSLAAATLKDIGVARATDLAGGFQAWMRLTRG
jgi:rhodanese-related sulfurtransferase